MTNRLAIILGLIILTLLALDLAIGGGATLFLSRKIVELIEWIAFWR